MKKFSELVVGDSFYMWYNGEFFEGVIQSVIKGNNHIELYTIYTKFKKEKFENCPGSRSSRLACREKNSPISDCFMAKA